MIRDYASLAACKRAAKTQLKKYMNNCFRSTAEIYEMTDKGRKLICEITEDDVL